MDTWALVEADRRLLADYLADLSPEQWEAQSLCADWTVRQVVAHLLVVPTFSKGKVFLNFAGSGFSLDRFSSKAVAGIIAGNTDEGLVETLRSAATSRNTPPGMKPVNVLGDLVVHICDIAEGAGRPLDLPTEHYVAALDSFKGMQTAMGCRTRIAGLALAATDADWTHGEGPRVEGTARDLLLAMTGRSVALDRLDGDGLDTLRGRLA